jgi:long-chain acyl-CoA synthetase
MQEITTLVELFERSCCLRGPAPLFGVRHDKAFLWVSYSEVHERVAQVRTLLRSLGVKRGDRVALIAENGIDWATVCYATAGCGAIIVPMYTAQRLSDWAYILRDCQPKVVFVGTKHLASALARIRDGLSFIEHVIVLQGSDADDSALPARLQALAGQTAPIEYPSPDDPADFIYTSGTTGQPKGVILSHKNIVSNVLASASTFPLYSSDRSLSFLPWAHCFGQTVDLHLMLHVGAQIGINGDVMSLLPNLGLVKPTILIAVPRIFYRIYDSVQKQISARPAAVRKLFELGLASATKHQRGERLRPDEHLWRVAAEAVIFNKIRNKFGGELRFVISGSAALSQTVGEFVNALGIQVFEGYGLTEASPVVSVNTPGNRKFGTVGRPLVGIAITIDRSTTNPSEDGEIIVEGPNVMCGYHGAPEETAQVITPEGRLRTGDMGHIDTDGYLVITGRIKEQFKLLNGRYVAPAPIEEHLRLSPLVSNCMLYGSDKPYCVLVVVPCLAALEEEARARGLTLSNIEEDAQVCAIVRSDLSVRARVFQSYMRPKKLLIVAEDFTVENGFLTPSMKVRRQAVINRYGDRLARLYAESTQD